MQAALAKLQSDAEPEAGFMHTAHCVVPAYNVQTAVDAEHALIVTHEVTVEKSDKRSLQPMAEAAQKTVGDPPSLNVVADGAYCNGAQAEACEAKGIVPHVPAQRGINNRRDGTLFARTRFHYDAASDRSAVSPDKPSPVKDYRKRSIAYSTAPAAACGNYALKEPLHPVSATLCLSASARRRAGAHAATCHPGP